MIRSIYHIVLINMMTLAGGGGGNKIHFVNILACPHFPDSNNPSINRHRCLRLSLPARSSCSFN